MKTNKNNNEISIAILLIGFVFYLVFSKPTENLFFNKNKEIETIEKFNLLNATLNLKALQKEKGFEAVVSQDSNIYSIVEIMPKYKNCTYYNEEDAQRCTLLAIQEYFNSAKFLKETNIEGRIFISFMVNEHALVQDVKLIRGLESTLDSLAIEHIKKMPKFASAGMQNNKAVKLRYVIPFYINK